MGEIITHMGDEKNDRVVFGQLEYIGLHCLPSITGFYLGDYTTDFPALEQVFVRQCPKMNTFSKGVVNAPKLKSVQTTEDEEERRWKNDLNTTIQLLFKETVSIHKINILIRSPLHTVVPFFTSLIDKLASYHECYAI